MFAFNINFQYNESRSLHKFEIYNSGYDIFQLKKYICPLATIVILVPVLLLGKNIQNLQV